VCFRPFSPVEGNGFITLAKKLVVIGAKYGSNVNTEEHLTCATTVLYHLTSVVAREKDIMRAKLAQIAKFGITTDLWTYDKTM